MATRSIQNYKNQIGAIGAPGQMAQRPMRSGAPKPRRLKKPWTASARENCAALETLKRSERTGRLGRWRRCALQVTVTKVPVVVNGDLLSYFPIVGRDSTLGKDSSWKRTDPTATYWFATPVVQGICTPSLGGGNSSIFQISLFVFLHLISFHMDSKIWIDLTVRIPVDGAQIYR